MFEGRLSPSTVFKLNQCELIHRRKVKKTIYLEKKVERKDKTQLAVIFPHYQTLSIRIQLSNMQKG